MIAIHSVLSGLSTIYEKHGIFRFRLGPKAIICVFRHDTIEVKLIIIYALKEFNRLTNIIIFCLRQKSQFWRAMKISINHKDINIYGIGWDRDCSRVVDLYGEAEGNCLRLLFIPKYSKILYQFSTNSRTFSWRCWERQLIKSLLIYLMWLFRAL